MFTQPNVHVTIQVNLKNKSRHFSLAHSVFLYKDARAKTNTRSLSRCIWEAVNAEVSVYWPALKVRQKMSMCESLCFSERLEMRSRISLARSTALTNYSLFERLKSFLRCSMNRLPSSLCNGDCSTFSFPRVL